MSLVVIPLMLLAWVPVTLPFNLEPRAATIYDYPSSDTQEREAYFGYAVALQHSAKDSVSWVVVGAPRANSTHHAHLNVTEPGAVFNCPFPADDSTTCDHLDVDPTGNDFNDDGGPRMEYHDMKDYGWLGGSLDTQPDFTNDRQATCVCSPLWKNQYAPHNVYANGACYWTPQRLPNDAPFKKELPLLDERDQIREHTYINAYGELGFSVHFPGDSRKIMMGAPGIHNWTGKVYFYSDYVRSEVGQSRKRRQVRSKKFFDDRPAVGESDDTTPDSLLGYALTSGMFLDVGKELYAAGAPRNEYGKVVLFEFRDSRYKQTSPRDLHLKGQQMGEYFGAALTAGDVNGDGLTDLIVGAPMFSHPKIPDVGRIHVYLSKDGRGLSDGPKHFYGRGVGVSRFGLTLASADLNMDQYQDVIVGAPWEDGGKGAVYIFMGSGDGLSWPHAQHLTPEDFTPGLRGFGMAVSRGIDIDQNGYPDLAVGSVLSDKVVLVRTRPVAVLKGRVVANPRTVPFDEETEITLTTCVRCEGHRIPADIRVQATLSLDHSKNKKPMPLAVLAGRNTSSLTFMEDLHPDEDKCRDHQVTIKKDKQDPDGDIVMRLEYGLLDSSALGLIEQPITDPYAPNSTETVVSIAKGCAEEVCKVDMFTKVAFLDGNNSSVVIGKINRLEVTVSNKGEHAYLPSLMVTLEPPLVVVQPPHQCIFHSSELVCNLTNPLKSSNEPERVEVSIQVDPGQMTDDITHTHLEVIVEGVGDEQDPSDNILALDLQLAMQAELELHGSSMEEQVAYKHKENDLIVANNNLKFNHTYVLIKKGPTSLEAIDLVVDVPISFSDGQRFVTAERKGVKFSSAFNCSWSDDGVSEGTEGSVHLATDSPGSDDGVSDGTEGSVHLATDSPGSDDGVSDGTEGSVQVATDSPGSGDDAGGDGGGGGGGGGDLSTHDEKVVKALSGAEIGTQFFTCSSDAIVCAQLTCHMERWIEYSESARVTVELEVDLAVLAAHISVQGGAVLGSSGTATIQGLSPHLAFIGNREVMGNAVTHIQPENLAGRGVPWWVILLAILVGLLLVTLLAYALYKKGFFKRKKLEEMKAHRARLQGAPTGVSNPTATG
ncbi:integrin alpha-PS4-like [Eriocheir sinensis]|uniref:integrin alpha-PS4-like n=1 Tax=Eriocheir sinensis TaxID=95602 RepID=UPI0021C65AFB|nr:integrin alpha-PS4-like [Eriocheir sinensis]